MARSDHAERIDRVYAAIEARLTAWASEEPSVRAAIVLGSRARDDHPADAWADLDVVLITVEAERLCADRDWLTAIGRPAITFVELTGGDVRELRVMFEGGFDLDLALMTPDQIEGLQASAPETAMMAFGRGHRVLVDKDGQAARMLESMPAAVEHGLRRVPAPTTSGKRARTSGTTPSGPPST